MAKLDGQIALVTGASRGIGREIALRLAADGAFVAVHCNRSTDTAQAVVDRMREAGGDGVVVSADLDQPGAAQTLYAALDAELTRRHGSPAFDILVNNAGIIKRAPIEAVSEDDFDATLRVNLKAPFFLIQQGLKRLRDGGRIINISSMGTRAAYPAMATYAPAKAGLEALTTLLAAHLGPRGITVNAVLPGLTSTDMNPVDPTTPQGQQALAGIALGRFGTPADVAGVVAFLASDDARWVTAQRIEASGGQRL